MPELYSWSRFGIITGYDWDVRLISQIVPPKLTPVLTTEPRLIEIIQSCTSSAGDPDILGVKVTWKQITNLR